MPAKVSGPFVLTALAVALLGACYDMPLIPKDSPAVAGSAGHGNAGTGAAGHAEAGAGMGAGAGAGASAGGAPPSDAGATQAEGGSTPNEGGASAGGAGNSGGSAGTTGQAGSGGVPHITWLDLSGSKAPSSSTTNAALGIQGWFYAYDDGCSKLTWDDTGRCASGKLCDPANLDNWGISVGFDFRYTGANGTPPNTKFTWNPEDFAARGVAWHIRGTAPQIQVWVLNMASSWHGQCNVMSCEISGPPDGVAPAALNGELDFDNMVKDYWGGSGTDYTFDPAAVFALQFKIAAVKVGATEFNFCIDELGIVR